MPWIDDHEITMTPKFIQELIARMTMRRSKNGLLAT